jgi:tripartite-type tricarboxylate transporter receptor subunit TctC
MSLYPPRFSSCRWACRVVSALAAVVVIALPILATIHPASAQETYPNRTIKLIVPFAAGGAGDAVGRVTAFYMQKVLNVSVVVENRPGAGGITGTDSVAKAVPDGYTLCVCSTGPITVAPWTEKLPYDPLKDLAPISIINTFPLVLVVNPKLEVKSAAEIVALSKQRPSGLSYSTIGAGGLVTFSAEIFRLQTGANLTAVPYRGGALATAAVVSGEVDLSFANVSDAMAQVEANNVRPLAVTSAARSEHMPQIPTLIELGLVEHPVESWNALFAPAGTPRHVIDRLAGVMAEMAKDPEIKKKMTDLGSSAVGNSPQEYAALLEKETARWEKALTAIGIKKKQ